MKTLIKKECRKIDGLFISLEEGFYFIVMDIKYNYKVFELDIDDDSR